MDGRQAEAWLQPCLGLLLDLRQDDLRGVSTESASRTVEHLSTDGLACMGKVTAACISVLGGNGEVEHAASC